MSRNLTRVPFPLHLRNKIHQKVPTPRRGCQETIEDWRKREKYSSPTPSFCRTTKVWAESNLDLAEKQIRLGCHGDFFVIGGTGYNKTLPLTIAWHRILVELKICYLKFMKDHESRSGQPYREWVFDGNLDNLDYTELLYCMKIITYAEQTANSLWFSTLRLLFALLPIRISTDTWPMVYLTIERLSTDYRPTIDQPSIDYRPTVDRLSTDYRPTIDRLSTAMSTDISVDITHSKQDPMRLRNAPQKVPVFVGRAFFILIRNLDL